MLTDQAAAPTKAGSRSRLCASGERGWHQKPSQETCQRADEEGKLQTVCQADPELKGLVVEASRSLATWDADRLEELALSCQALNGKLLPEHAEARQELTRQAQDAVSDMAVFARVLEATRANLEVMKRLRDLHAGKVEYSERQVCSSWMENRHGDH